MDLPSKLEKWAREMDRERWHGDEYDCEMVELCDLLRESAQQLRFLNGYAKEWHDIAMR